jgi:hypothetical protein
VADPKPKKAPPPTYHPAPKTLPGFPKAVPAKPKTGMGGGKKRKRWKNDDGDILEWDYQHGKVERYDDKGKHKGEFDPANGTQTKPEKKDRTITPTIWKARKKEKMIYYLTWYEKNGDGQLGEAVLADVGEDDVREAFALEEDEPAGDCLEVDERHADWLGEIAKGVDVRLDLFTYFVEATQSV